MFFTVIIPTCHRNGLLAKCLDLLAPGKQVLAAEKYEVIVTDDGSKSTAKEMINRNYPWVRWVEGPKEGAGANRNNGAKCARGYWLVFTDDDCLPDTNFLAGYWKAAMENSVLVLEGKTSPADVQTRVDMECPANEHGGYLWSCNMAIRKDLFLELGGFDTNFSYAAMEDVDLRTRLVNRGIIFKFVPDALVLHPMRLRKGCAFLRGYCESMIFFISRHPENEDLISLKSISVSFIRKLIKQLPPVALACRGRGLGRELLLNTYCSCILIYYSLRRRIKYGENEIKR